MINKNEFAKIRKELEKKEKLREDVISRSRKIIKLSKVAIYSVLRDELGEAKKLVSEMKSAVAKLPSDDAGTGMGNAAVQEYVEAATLLSFVSSGKIPSASELNSGNENYLAGISDLTGELVRLAVAKAIKNEFEKVIVIKDAVDEIFGEFLKMDLRNGELRKKSDQIKWNLQKIEDLVYRMSFR